MRQVTLRDARAVVPNGKRVAGQGDFHPAGRAAEFGGVVKQVGHRALEPVGHGDDPGRGDVRGELDPRPVQPGTVHHVLGQRVPVQLLEGRGGFFSPRELHGVGDQAGQVVDPEQDRGDQPFPVVRVEQFDFAQHLDVGAQGGERGAQLVRGVGDELALPVGGVLHGAEHGVEADREPAKLVAVGPVARVDAVRQVAGRGYPLGRLGQLADRAQRGAGYPPAKAAGQQDSGQSGGEQFQAELAELVLGGPQR